MKIFHTTLNIIVEIGVILQRQLLPDPSWTLAIHLANLHAEKPQCYCQELFMYLSFTQFSTLPPGLGSKWNINLQTPGRRSVFVCFFNWLCVGESLSWGGLASCLQSSSHPETPSWLVRDSCAGSTWWLLSCPLQGRRRSVEWWLKPVRVLL